MDAGHRLLHIYDMTHGLPASAIPSYSLYGERGELGDLLHYEPLPERARRYGGIDPHRHQHLHQFFLFETAAGEVSLDSAGIQLRSQLLLNVPPGCVHGFRFADNTSGSVITVSAAALQAAALPDDVEALVKHAFACELDQAVRAVGRDIATEYLASEPTRTATLGHLAALLVLRIARLAGKKAATAAASEHAPAVRLTTSFETLLERRYQEHWPVATYAATLHVTPTHLGRVIRSTRGATPSELIAARLMLQVKRLLAYTNRPIWHVGEDLGFVDPAYFTRFVKRHTGLAPSNLRRQLQR